MNKNEFIEKYNMRELTKEDNLEIEIVYVTSNNFTKQKLYENSICLLRKGTAEKLLKVNEELNKKGLKIKIWDAFRSMKYQEKMWEVYPDERFVANPKKGNSNHCKGSAVDITLCTLDGVELKMPTEFDHFGEESHRDYYKNLDEETRKNAILLEETMKKYGFCLNPFEWWHYNDVDDYDIIYETIE